MTVLSHAALDQARHEGDALADPIAAALAREAWVVNATLRHVHRNDEPLPAGVPAPVRRLFTRIVLPEAIDPVRVARAQRWASRNLATVTVALFCASLPTAYGAARGARVLAATGRMGGREPDRRVNETAQFLLDVLAEGAFSPGGSGLLAVRKVRLLHASVRGHLGAQQRVELGEVPINQEDLLGTLFSFSVVVLRAAAMLGVPVSEQEAADYYHLWKGVGAMLGIDAAYLPDDVAGARALSARICARQHAPSAHGRALMASLLEAMGDHVPAARAAPRYLVRYLVGDTLAAQLGIDVDDALRAGLSVLGLLPGRRALPAVARSVSPLVGRRLLSAIVTMKLRGETAAFAMRV